MNFVTMENPETQRKMTFNTTEREEFRKQKRVENSLGALLLGIASSGPKPTEDNVSTNTSDAGLSGNAISAKSDFGWSAACSEMGFGSSDRGDNSGTNNIRHNGSKGAGVSDSSKKNKLQEHIPREFESWTETRMMDDDHDNEWFTNENKKLDELYGEGIVTAKYTDQGGLSYYCELCFATMNAKIPLEMHCSGMKHLKKKDTYEKNKASGKENPLVERRKILESSDKAPPPRGSSRKERSDSGRQEPARNRGRSPVGRVRSPLGRARSPLGRARSPLGRARSPLGRARSPLSRSRSPPSYGRDVYRREQSSLYDSERERDPYGRSNESDPYGRGRDIIDASDRRDLYNDGCRDDYWGHPGSHHDERYRSDERSRHAGDYSDVPRYSDGYCDSSRYPDDRLPPHDDRGHYTDDFGHRSRDYPPHSRLPDDRSPRSRYDDSLDRPHSSGSLPRRRGERSPYSSEHLRLADDRQGRLPSPPPAKPPPPVISAKLPPPAISVNSSDDSQNLSSGPAAALLAKLAQCTVKNESDAELASNVIDLLLKSLKQYNDKIGEKSAAELMEQAEIKLGTAKAIRKVNKSTVPLSATTAADPVSIAMETLRRAAAEKLPSLASAGSPVFKYF